MNIAVIAYNSVTTWDACQVLAKADFKNTILKIDKLNKQIEMDDGTVYKAVLYDLFPLDGIYFNQLIIVDDDRWTVINKRKNTINWIINYNDLRQFDWQVQNYKW